MYTPTPSLTVLYISTRPRIASFHDSRAGTYQVSPY